MATRAEINRVLLLALFSFSPLFAAEPPSVSTALLACPAESAPSFKDDSDLERLRAAAEQSRNFYSQNPSSAVYFFGGDLRTGLEMERGFSGLAGFLSSTRSAGELNSYISENFDVFRSQGLDGKGQVVFSAYYEHTLSASLFPTEEYRYPIYSRPQELADVYLETFDPSRKGERWAGRLDGTRLVPYYSREEIDSKGVLKGRGLEIGWAISPLDILFLQIQGSGWLEVGGTTQTLHIRYSGDNGRPFRSVGQYLIESGALPRENFTRDKMVDYLNRQPEKRRQEILNQNSRYIFFEITSSTNLTRGSLMVPLTAGRSIASDPKHYPQGALAWIETAGIRRFVLNQDEGGAIKGPGRIDFFVGGGREAEAFSQKMWSQGSLYFLAPRRKP